MKKLILSIFVFVMVLNVYAGNVSIFFSNDTHGRLISYFDKENVERGGAANFAGLYKFMKKQYPDSMLVDAGDIFHGAHVNDRFEGKPVIEFMNYLGYDLFIPGNHDFAYGLNTIKKYSKNARFTTIGTNILDNNGNHIFEPYYIKEINGCKIGYLGFLTPVTMLSLMEKNKEGLDIREVDDYVTKYMKILRKKGADVIVFLNHMGYEDDVKLAEKYSPDFIVGGHTHTRLNFFTKVNNTYIVQSNGGYVNLGHLYFDYENGKVQNVKYHLYRNRSPYVSPDKYTEKMVEKYNVIVEKEMNEVIAESSQDYEHSYTVEDSVLYHYLMRLLEKAAGVDFVHINYKGIRAPIKKGEIRVRDIYNMLPFGNSAVFLKLKGSQITGDKYIYSYKDFDPDKEYTVLINSYLAEKNSTYRDAPNKEFKEYTVRDIVINYLRKIKNI